MEETIYWDGISQTDGWRLDDRIFIYKWKTGVLKVMRVLITFFLLLVLTEMHRVSKYPIKVIQASYWSRNLLSSYSDKLPNSQINALDIFRIPTTPTIRSLRPMLTLNLPSLAHGHVLGDISCRSEPNRISLSSIPRMKQREKYRGYFSPNRSFIPSSEGALCMFDL